MKSSIKSFCQMFGQIMFKNTLSRQDGIISIYFWLIYLCITTVSDTIAVISAIPKITAHLRNYVIIDICLMFEAGGLLFLYKKLVKCFPPIKEIMGVMLSYTQAIYVVEYALYYDKTASQFLIYFSTLSYGALLIYYDTIPNLIRSITYYILIYAYGIVIVVTKKIDFTSVISLKRFIVCYFYIFILGVCAIYGLIYHRYLNLINIIGLEKTYSTTIKLMELSGVGLSVENKEHIIFRNSIFSHQFNQKSLMSEETINNLNKRDEQHFDLNKHILFLYNKLYDVYIVRDFTEITRSEQEKYFQMLIATITHELRTPLNIIMSIFHVIRESITDALLHEEIDKGLCAVAMQENLINDILDVAKLSHGELELNLQPINIKEIIKAIFLLFKYKVGKDIEFNYQLENTIPEFILIDERRYKQVVLNLLSNSSKFTSQGMILLKVRYIEGFLHTSVIDSGIGIEKKDYGKIFKQFGMVKSAGYLNKGGTGLGLNLCKNLVNKMGGEINFDSIPNKKTEFSFFIKAGKVDKLNEPISLHTRVVSKVLIVDDNFMNIAVLEAFCKKAGVMYLSFHNSEDVIKRVSEIKEDFIGLLDLHMPKVDGYTLAQLLIKANVNMKLYAVSGDDRSNILQKCKQSGFKDVIEKPISYEKFVRLLEA